MKTSVTEVLKVSCRKAHIKTEKTLIEKLKSINSVDDYVNILSIFYGYYAPLENEIEKFISAEMLPDIESRKRSLFIKSDLLKLNHTTPVACSRQLPHISSFLQAAGAMYVLEGSTLGGVHIAQMLAAKPAVKVLNEAMSFFKGHEAQTLEMWHVFKQFLDTRIDENDFDVVVQAAIETFELLDKWTLTKDNDRKN